MAYLLLVCQLLLTVVLLVAATGKLLNSEQLAAALRLSHIPKALIRPLVVLTPAVELCLAVGLVLSTPLSLPFIMAATVGLFCIFTVWMLAMYIRGLHLKCGCFGTASSEIGPHTILRNVLLIAASLGGFVLAQTTRSPLPGPSLWMLMTVLSLGMSLVLLRSFQGSRSALFLSMTELQQFQEKIGSHSELSS